MMPVVANNPSSAVFSIILIIAYENIRKKKKMKKGVPKIIELTKIEKPQ